MEGHVKAVGIISIIFGALMAFIGLGLFAIIAGAGAISGEIEAAWITGIVGTVIGGLLVILSLPSIVGGVGLLNHRPWARILIMIVAIFSLLNFPIGTAYGVYALVILMHDQAKPLFAGDQSRGLA